MLSPHLKIAALLVAGAAAILLVPSSLHGQSTAVEPSIQLLVASPALGINGTITRGNVSLWFESKLDDSAMRSEIRDSNGHRYWLYIEDFASDEPAP